MSAFRDERTTDSQARADVITCALETGLPAELDQLGETCDPSRGFLRRAWYSAQTGPGLCTLLARRRDGTPVVAIPTRLTGPMLMQARSVSASYWPFRSFPMARDASEAEIAALLGCPIVERAIGPVLRIGPVYHDDPGIMLMISVARQLGWSVLVRELGTTFLQDIAALSAQGAWPGKSRSRKIRTYERKLEEAHGAPSLRVVTGSDWSDAVWRDLAAIEAQSWVGTQTDQSGAKFINSDNLRHWQTAVGDSVIARQLRATILYVAERPIAFSFDLDTGDVMYGIASSYAESMARFSPGQIVTNHLIAQAIARGVRIIDWGSGDNGYKSALGAVPGPRIIDVMLVRSPVLAAALKPRWEMTGQSARMALAEGFAASVGELSRASALRIEHVLLPGLALAAAAAAMDD